MARQNSPGRAAWADTYLAAASLRRTPLGRGSTVIQLSVLKIRAYDFTRSLPKSRMSPSMQSCRQRTGKWAGGPTRIRPCARFSAGYEPDDERARESEKRGRPRETGKTHTRGNSRNPILGAGELPFLSACWDRTWKFKVRRYDTLIALAGFGEGEQWDP